MSGLYNMMFGEANEADKLLALLGFSRKDFYRYRDCYLAEGGYIAVYTRGGGNNRSCHCWDHWFVPREEQPQNGEHLSHCVIPIQESCRNHQWFTSDEDDKFDCTYATFYFRVPDDILKTISDIKTQRERDMMW